MMDTGQMDLPGVSKADMEGECEDEPGREWTKENRGQREERVQESDEIVPEGERSGTELMKKGGARTGPGHVCCGKISDIFFQTLAKKILPVNILEFTLYLVLNYVELMTAKVNHPHDIVAATFDILIQWRNQQCSNDIPVEDQIKKLVDALHSSDQSDVADWLKEAYGNDDSGNDAGQGIERGFNSPGQSGRFHSPVVSSRAKAKRSQRLIPCNIAQILQATVTDGEFFNGDVVIHQVLVIGIVRKVVTSAMNTLYYVDDMSGPPIEVRQWIEMDKSTMDQQPMAYQENMYIKIAGNVCFVDGKRNIRPFRIMPVTDLNEVTMHMAEVVHTHRLVSKMTVAEITSYPSNEGISMNELTTELTAIS